MFKDSERKKYGNLMEVNKKQEGKQKCDLVFCRRNGEVERRCI